MSEIQVGILLNSDIVQKENDLIFVLPVSVWKEHESRGVLLIEAAEDDGLERGVLSSSLQDN